MRRVPGAVHVKEGKPRLLKALRGYNAAAVRAPWLVLVDLDDPQADPAEKELEWLPAPSRGMCLSTAVSMVEAWLLADRERLAQFLHVSRTRVPRRPDELPRPKRAVVGIARRSPSAAIRSDLVPREGTGREVGPAYTARMAEFAAERWRPGVARAASPSLDRCMRRLDRVLSTHR